MVSGVCYTVKKEVKKMYHKQTCKFQFISVVSKSFTDKEGREVPYHNVNVIPYDEKGELAPEPEILGASEEMLPVLRSLNRGEDFVACTEAYVKKPKIVKIKRG